MGFRDRFVHEGDTILPGSGTSWTHVGLKNKSSKGGGNLDPETGKWKAREGKQGKMSAEDLYEELFGEGKKEKEEETLNAPATEEDNFVDLDELPWQVIAVMDPDMLEKLMRYKNYFDYNVKRALSGS